MFIADLVMGTTSFILLLVFLYVTFKVVKLIQCNDKILLAMLVFLDITLISKYSYMGHMIIIYFTLIEIKNV
jgi:hypothetical protein